MHYSPVMGCPRAQWDPQRNPGDQGDPLDFEVNLEYGTPRTVSWAQELTMALFTCPEVGDIDRLCDRRLDPRPPQAEQAPTPRLAAQ